ncbi:MAG: acetolactate synthase large subunit [Thermodesulfobacteriota bacterium]
MNGAELFIRCLCNEGVEYVFGLPGEENLHLVEALHGTPITFVTCRHEQGAAFMADVYGRLTGRPGVCLATLGPGATNLVTGVADANLDHAPLIAIAGQAATTRLHKESHQVLDLASLFAPVTRYSTRIVSPAVIAEVIRKAFRIAQTEKMGACFIELPEDIAQLPAAGEPLPAHNPVLPEPQTGQLEKAAALIRRSRRPMILAGNGAIRDHACQALRRFAEQCNIPVANTFMAKGVIPFSHPLALGSAGLQARDYVGCGFGQADCILCVGYDLVEYHPHLWHPGADRVIIDIDSTPPETDSHYPVSAALVGDIAVSLDRLAAMAAPHPGEFMRPLREALLAAMAAHAADPGFPVKPQRLIHDLREALPPEALVICDVGAHKLWMARMFPCEEPNTCLISNGFASMGIALPGAVAARLVRPRQAVVAVTGDGGFLMNVQELETARRLGLAFVVLIWNDGGYGLIEWKQQNAFGRSSQVRFTNPDFVLLAESFGARGCRVSHPDELAPMLREALAQPVVTVIDCPVDYRENLRLSEELRELICPI